MCVCVYTRAHKLILRVCGVLNFRDLFRAAFSRGFSHIMFSNWLRVLSLQVLVASVTLVCFIIASDHVGSNLGDNLYPLNYQF